MIPRAETKDSVNARSVTLLRRDDPVGTGMRVVALVMVLLVCLGVAFTIRNVLSVDVSYRFLLAAFLIVVFSMAAGLVLSEYPRGVDNYPLRLGFATFCRTGLPLLVVMLVARYSVATFASQTAGFLIAFYAVGLTTSIGLSLYRFSGSCNGTKSQEVDSAAVQ